MDNGASSYHRFLEGDESGLEELVEAYSDNLIFFINSFINDFALSEDLMSDTFLELIVKKPRFKGDSSFKTYLFKIGRNKAFDYLRKQKRTVTVPFHNAENEISDVISIENNVLKNDQQKHLNICLENIKQEYREVLHLLYFEEMSYDSVSIIMKKSKKQIENLTYRAKLTLKTTLEKEGFIYEEL